MKSIKRNYIYNVIENVVTILSPIITVPYISRVIGSQGVGRISFAESVMTLFLVGAGFGVSIYGEREVSYVQDDRHKRSVVFWNAFLLKAMIVPVFLIAYLLYVRKSDDVLVYYLALHIVAEVFAINWYYMGIEEFGFLVLRSVIIRILQIIYIFLFVKNSSDVVTYAMASVYVIILTNASSMLYLPKHLDKVKLKELSPFKCFVPSLVLFLPTIASLVYSVLDKAMLGWIGQDLSENGYYEEAYNLSRMVLTIIISISSVMIPRVGFHFSKNNREELNSLMYKGYRYVFMLGMPMVFGLACVSSNFVPWFFGPGWNPVIPLLVIFAPICLIVGMSNMTGKMYLVSTKRENTYTLTIVVGVVLNLILNFFFISRWKAIGAALASVIAELAVLLIGLFVIRTELSLFQIFKSSIKYLLASIVMSGVLLLESRHLSPSILNTMILVLSGIIIYFAVLLITRDSLFMEDFKTMLAKLHKQGGSK